MLNVEEQMFCGIKIMIDHNLDKRVQNKRHKKARINKKWAKQYGYHYESNGQAYYVKPTEFSSGYIVMGQAMYKMLEREIENES